MIVFKPEELKVIWKEYSQMGHDRYWIGNVDPFGTMLTLIHNLSARAYELHIGNQEVTMLHKRIYPTHEDAQNEAVAILKQVLEGIIKSN
jgi:hypothetical protein